MTVVNIEQIETALSIITNYLRDQKKTEFVINEDYYWNIPWKIRYDNYTEPKEFTLGQISDDWEEIKKLIEHKSEPVGPSLVWLSNILRCIGEKVTV